MKIVLSPAKSLDFENAPVMSSATLPVLLPESVKLINKLRKLSQKKIGTLMHISPSLADLNYERFQNWEIPFTAENSKPALYVFTGEAYRGMDAKSFSKDDVLASQNYLRILSGLYGLLKPLDLMQSYRLEMGTKFSVTPTTKDLYAFWGNKITQELNKELAEDDGVLVNLASNEYFKAINTKQLKSRVITCSFKDEKDGAYKVIGVYAKFARGLMTRFIIQNKLTDPEQIKAFDIDGYIYNEGMSSENEFVFTRG